MTTTAPEVKAGRDETNDDHRIAHYRKGSELKALCGKRLRGVPAPPEAEICVVCKELCETPAKDLRGSL